MDMRKFDQKNSTQGQSAIEYLLLLTAVITVLIVFLNPSGSFRGVVETTINAPANIVDTMARTAVLPPP